MTQTQYFLGFIPYSSAITVRAVAATALASISFGAYSLHSMGSPISLFGSSRFSMASANSAMGDILGSGTILGLHSAKQIAVVGFNADETSAPTACYISGDCVAQSANSGNGYTADRGMSLRGGAGRALSSARGQNGGNYAASGNYSARSGVSGVGMGGGGYGASGAGSTGSNVASSRASNSGSVGQAAKIGTPSAIGGASAVGVSSSPDGMASQGAATAVAGTRGSANAQLNASENAVSTRAATACGALASCESEGVLAGENTVSATNSNNSRRSSVSAVRSNDPTMTTGNGSNSRPSDLDEFTAGPLLPDAPTVPLGTGRTTPPTTVDFTPNNEPHNTNAFLRFVPVDCNDEPTIPACTGAVVAAPLLQVVPEPSTVVLLSAGLLGLLVAHRRRSSTNS